MDNISLTGALHEVMLNRGSDLHLVEGAPPIARVAGELKTLPYPPLSETRIEELIAPILSDERKEAFQRERRLHFSHTILGLGRFRVSLHRSMGKIGATLRILSTKIFPLSNLGLPPILGQLAARPSGIIFVTGTTGSGKSTTLAAMLEHINQEANPGKIVTVEDPIEMIFRPCRSIFVQKEVGSDTPSFEAGILDSLRQDPDVICIGELRDSQSIYAALLAAETGHLVLTTLHARDASTVAQRIITAVSSQDQDIVREQLAASLEAVVSMELLPRKDKKGLVPAVEVLVATPAIRQMIRENNLGAINDAIHSGSRNGMISKDSCLKKLYGEDQISKETALSRMRNPELLARS
ncbi:MAG: PilT/PilU family type 4a pilus ATPase [Elusimicrobia bacterium]|nr:PilT/PilU family type 4a pilus ATPase [Elusimicrobiota bacterium]